MLAWHVPFLGWRRFPADLSEFEIAHFFTLKPIDIRAVCSRYKESLRLGAALQLGFLTMCGRPLRALQRVPTDLLQHLGEQLTVPAPDIATLRAIYRRRRLTLFEHQTWAISYLGMRRFQASDGETLMGPLTDVVRSGVSGDHLLAATRRILYEHRIVIPGRRRLSELAGNAATAVERDALEVIERDIPMSQRMGAIESLLGQLDSGALRAPCLAARQREVLVTQSAQGRPLVKMLLALDLRSEPPSPWPSLLDTWSLAYHREFDYVAERMCPVKSRAWAQLCHDADGVRTFHAAEAQLLWELRQGLRRGSLFVPHSLSFRSPKVLFDRRGTTVRAPGSERDPVEFLDQLCAQLEVALEYVAEAVWFEELDIEATKIHQHRLGPHDTPPDLPELRDALLGSLPMVHLPQILVDVDARVRFSWLLLGREPVSEEELVYLYVALLGHAMDIGAKRLSLMAPGLSVSGLTDALQLLEEPGPLRRANAATVEFLQAHLLAAHWGNTGDCAADAMSLDGTRHLWLARTDPKRRTLSTATYVHTIARHGIAYDQPIPITRRQDGAAIEGALRQSVMPIRRVMTDTHGYSAFGMGLAKFVGVDLCPRLKSFRDRRLHIPRGGRVKVPDVLKPVCLADVSLPAIIEGWSDMSDIADAVVGGRLSAVLACERHGTAARGQKGYRAGHELGLLLRTLHQCDTLSIPDFRRATLRLLNDNERTHTLQRQIRRPGSRSRRGRPIEELGAQSGALALVTNLVMAWNTHQMQATLDRWRTTGARKVEAVVLSHITPTGFDHVNFDGVLAFSLEQHRARILPSSPPPEAPDRAVG